MICIHPERSGTTQELARSLLEDIAKLVAKMKIEPMDLTGFLLPDEDDYLKPKIEKDQNRELEKTVKKGNQVAEQPAAPLRQGQHPLVSMHTS